jgi:hypothetical protein
VHHGDEAPLRNASSGVACATVNSVDVDFDGKSPPDWRRSSTRLHIDCHAQRRHSGATPASSAMEPGIQLHRQRQKLDSGFYPRVARAAPE